MRPEISCSGTQSLKKRSENPNNQLRLVAGVFPFATKKNHYYYYTQGLLLCALWWWCGVVVGKGLCTLCCEERPFCTFHSPKCLAGVFFPLVFLRKIGLGKRTHFSNGYIGKTNESQKRGTEDIVAARDAFCQPARFTIGNFRSKSEIFNPTRK